MSLRRHDPPPMRWLIYTAAVLLLVLALAVGAGLYVWRRALPQVEGTAQAPGLDGPAEIVRDRWGIPHIFAASDADAYYALGWAMTQDRLFQMDLVRHVAQGRLAELLGEAVVPVDRLFRTLDLPGTGRRMFAQVRPEVRAALDAFTAGANASLAALGSRLPPEYALLRTTPAPFRPDDFVAMVGFMTWGLNPAWRLEPLYERIVATVGPRRAAELFPGVAQGPLATAWHGPLPQPTRLQLDARNEDLLAALPGLHGSNAFALAPARSASGHALLANDPHLALSLPGTWYLAHLRTPQHEVLGAFLPGVPFAAIGHNRQVAWGFVNAYLDAGDFFVERLDDAHPGQVLYRGRWVPLGRREETIRVKGGAPVPLTVLTTPHGPLVQDLLPGQEQALSYRWVYAAAEDANEINGFYDLNRARGWESFRAALAQFGTVAQRAVYADGRGHIGEQTSGRIPRRAGRRDGLRFRAGWTGTEEWEGFWPFDRNPHTLDPPDGVIAAANEPPARALPFYFGRTYEPEDRILRLRELLARKGRFTLEALEGVQTDTLFVTARALAPQVVAAFADAPPPEEALRAAVELLRGWDGTMAMDSGAAAVFAAFYKHLFYEMFSDELGEDVLDALRERGNQSAVMMHAVLRGGLDDWLDRTDTPAREDRAVIFRSALRKAVAELTRLLGTDPQAWQWGTLHRLVLRHPLGRVAWLAPFFNVGPLPLPGHAQTVNKAQFQDGNYRVYTGPSLRMLTDLGDPAHGLGVLPTGQSGIPASPHYDDLTALWRQGRYLPLALEREDIDRFAEGRLVLQP